MKKKIVLLLAGVVAALSLSACTGDNLSDPSMRTLRYEGGDFNASKFKECVDEGEKLASNDKFYPYPATQREAVWDSANYGKGSKSADYKTMALTSKDGTPVYAKVKISFFLNTDCEPVTVGKKKYKGGTLQAFHELIGKTRKAYFNEDGTYEDGWLWAMTNYIGNPAQDSLVATAKRYNADDLWLKEDVKTALEDTLRAQLPNLVNKGMETDLQFYKDFSVTVYTLTPDEAYRALYKERNSANVKAQTAEANKVARIAEAEANAAVARAEAQAKRAEISGYGGVDGYLKHEAVEKGLNPWQPSVSGIYSEK